MAFQGRWVASAFLNLTGLPVFVALLCLSLDQVLPCPSNCQLCSLYTVECKEVTSLREVLVTLPRSTQQILLQQGNLSEIPPLAFSNFTNLHFLSLTGFRVSSLADRTFFMFHINYLKILDLSNNHLLSCMIEPLAFSGLHFLEELVLNNNSLDIVKRSWFLEMPGLNKLFLAINRITYLPPRTFENLTKLDELVVSSNMIQYLSMDTFYGLFSLTKLDLSRNKILFINFEAFHHMQALKSLFLFQNRLTTLPSLPNSISFLSLHKNPWVCNCQLIHSMELMQARIQSPEGVTCRRPPDLAGHQVSRTRLLGCTFLTPPSFLPSSTSPTNFPPSDSGKFKLIYGSLGGFFLGLTTGLFCCFCLSKCCSCPHFADQLKEKPSSKQEDKSSDEKLQILSSLQVAQNLGTAFEVDNIVRKACCGHSVYAPQTGNREQMRFQRPLVAYLSVDTMGRSVVTFHEKGSETRCPILGQPCSQAPRENTHWMPEVAGTAGDGVSQEKHGINFRHRLNGPCALSTATDQRERKESGLGQCVDTHQEGPTLHPIACLRDTPSLHAMVHIDFPDRQAMKIEPDRSTACKSSLKRNEIHQSRSPIPVSHCGPGGKRDSHRQPHHQHQVHFTSSESNMEFWQEGWMGKGVPKEPDHCLLSAGQLKKSQKWKHLCPRPTSTPSFSSTASQQEANRFHCMKEPCANWVSVIPCPEKRAQLSPYLDDAQKAGEMILIHRKSRNKQRDSGISWTRNQSSMTRLWKCQNCGCEGFVPCPVDQTRLVQPGFVPKCSGGLDATSHWSSTSEVQLKEPELAPTFFGNPHNTARTQSEKLWLDTCLSGFQPSPAIPNCAGEINSIYEYPSPLVSSTALNSTCPAEPLLQNPVQEADQVQDFCLNTLSVLVAEHSVDQFPLKMTGNRGWQCEESQDPSEMCLKEVADSCSQRLEEFLKDAASSSSHVNSHLLRTDANPLREDFPFSNKSSGNTDGASEMVPSITSSCLLVQKMYQIDFPFPVEEERPNHAKAESVEYLTNEATYQ